MVMDQEQSKLCAVWETNLCRDALVWLKIFTSTFKPRNSILVYYRNWQKNTKDNISQSGYTPPHVTLFFFPVNLKCICLNFNRLWLDTRIKMVRMWTNTKCHIVLYKTSYVRFCLKIQICTISFSILTIPYTPIKLFCQLSFISMPLVKESVWYQT